jgi:hypothetical protein
MTKPTTPAPPRNELVSIAGINERIVSYLENLSRVAQDATMITGEGPPTVAANSSRLYLDLANNQLYVNTSPEYGSTTGWQVV